MYDISVTINVTLSDYYKKHMKILVITGSPHKKGTSALLADNFIAGALEAGHEVFRFDTIFQVTQPCLARARSFSV